MYTRKTRARCAHAAPARSQPFQLPLHIRGDQTSPRVRLGDEPQRQRERQGRAQCNNNRLKLGGEHDPLSNEHWLRLAGIADGARGAGRVIEERVGVEKVERGSGWKCDEYNETSSC